MTGLPTVPRDSNTICASSSDVKRYSDGSNEDDIYTDEFTDIQWKVYCNGSIALQTGVSLIVSYLLIIWP